MIVLTRFFFFCAVIFLSFSPSYANKAEFEKQVCEAIKNSRLLGITYKYDASLGGCGPRIVEPYKLGLGKNQKMYIRGYQLEGCSKSGNLPAFRTFRFDRILNLKTLDGFISEDGVARKKLLWDGKFKGKKYIAKFLCDWKSN